MAFFYGYALGFSFKEKTLQRAFQQIGGKGTQRAHGQQAIRFFKVQGGRGDVCTLSVNLLSW
jgi:hypothetical protein